MILKLFDDMSQCTEAEVQRLLPLVSEQRREQALRFRHLFGRFACLKSYELLQWCVADVISDAAEDEDFKRCLRTWDGSFVYNDHGKPFMHCQQKAGTGDVDFSISHCKNGIMVALDYHSIGVDIERFHQAEDSLLRKTMSESEIELIHKASNPDIAFTRLWTQKEAWLKMRGTGIVDELPHVLEPLSQQQTYEMRTVVDEKKAYVYSIVKFLPC